MNNDEFMYFFHGTNVNDISKINDIFKNGLISNRGNDMSSTLWPVRIGDGEFGKKVKEYSGIKGNAVFVIKIPKYYLTPRVSNGQLQQIPIPIWKLLPEKGEHGEISQLTPELVYGVYLAENESFIQNPNYSQVYDPSGLQFDNQQIDYLLNYDVLNMYNFAVDRNNKSYDELVQIDNNAHNWDNAVAQYSAHFGINQNNDQHHHL